MAVKSPQCRVFANIEFGELIAAAVKIRQCSVIANIEFGELIAVAVKAL